MTEIVEGIVGHNTDIICFSNKPCGTKGKLMIVSNKRDDG